MKINFKAIFIGAAITLAFILGKSCSPDCPKVIETITTHKTDTIWGDTITKVKLKPYKVHDTIIKSVPIPLDSNELAEFFKMRGYNTTYRDSNIEVEVYNEVVGYKIAENINYRLLKPLIIRDSIFTLNTIEGPVKAPKYVLGIGADFTPKNLYLGAQLGVKRNNFDLAYDPFNKQVKIGYRYTIFRSKK